MAGCVGIGCQCDTVFGLGCFEPTSTGLDFYCGQVLCKEIAGESFIIDDEVGWQIIEYYAVCISGGQRKFCRVELQFREGLAGDGDRLVETDALIIENVSFCNGCLTGCESDSASFEGQRNLLVVDSAVGLGQVKRILNAFHFCQIQGGRLGELAQIHGVE